MESRIHGDMYVRFGGRYGETYCRKAERHSVPSLQTNLAEVQPERMQKLMDRFKVPELRDTEGMYTHAALDRMVETQQWLCPIRADKRENGAYYSPSKDIVVLPMKAQSVRYRPTSVWTGRITHRDRTSWCCP